MSLTAVSVRDFRCLTDVSLKLDPKFNLVYGQNASGKTSLLEALAYLGRGKSFRTAPTTSVVAHGKAEFVVFGRMEDGGRERSIGVRNGRNGLEIRIDGESASGIAELAEALPLQVIDPEVHRLVAGGPEERRRFMDWVVFHVEPRYLGAWRRLRRVLRQRNAALRENGRPVDLETWDAEFVSLSEEVDRLRRGALGGALDRITATARNVLGVDVSLVYRRGWKEGADLKEQLKVGRERDVRAGSTQLGPHRAELKIETDQRTAKRLVSRGQQKLLASGMIIGATSVVREALGKNMLLLLDDPAAELDRSSLSRLLEAVMALGVQLVVTSLEREDIPFPDTPRVFHVEHGHVSMEPA